MSGQVSARTVRFSASMALKPQRSAGTTSARPGSATRWNESAESTRSNRLAITDTCSEPDPGTATQATTAHRDPASSEALARSGSSSATRPPPQRQARHQPRVRRVRCAISGPSPRDPEETMMLPLDLEQLRSCWPCAGRWNGSVTVSRSWRGRWSWPSACRPASRTRASRSRSRRPKAPPINVWMPTCQRLRHHTGSRRRARGFVSGCSDIRSTHRPG